MGNTNGVKYGDEFASAFLLANPFLLFSTSNSSFFQYISTRTNLSNYILTLFTCRILLKTERLKAALTTVKTIFSEFSEDGRIVKTEGLAKAMRRFGGEMSNDELQDLFNFVDINDSHAIDLKEFLVALTVGSVLQSLKFDASKGELVEMLSLIVSAYLLFDPAGSGSITKADIDKMISESHHAGAGGMLSKERWDEMDWDHNGNIDFAEFVFAFSNWIDLDDVL